MIKGSNAERLYFGRGLSKDKDIAKNIIKRLVENGESFAAQITFPARMLSFKVRSLYAICTRMRLGF